MSPASSNLNVDNNGEGGSASTLHGAFASDPEDLSDVDDPVAAHNGDRAPLVEEDYLSEASDLP